MSWHEVCLRVPEHDKHGRSWPHFEARSGTPSCCSRSSSSLGCCIIGATCEALSLSKREAISQAFTTMMGISDEYRILLTTKRRIYMFRSVRNTGDRDLLREPAVDPASPLVVVTVGVLHSWSHILEAPLLQTASVVQMALGKLSHNDDHLDCRICFS